MTTKLWLIPAALLLAIVLEVKPLPKRETIVKPEDERVLLLGASSGVGRDLAHTYATRRARM